jgi:prepilin-type N-terminal cleavage/methylation domain-containing protein
MKKAFTLVEILIVIVVLGILAAFLLPGYGNIRKRAEYREASGLLNLVRAGAKYYDLKYGINHLALGGAGAWDAMRVDEPSTAHLTYNIIAGPELEIRSPDGNVLYTYRLPDGPGVTTADPDTAYLPGDLPQN